MDPQSPLESNPWFRIAMYEALIIVLLLIGGGFLGSAFKSTKEELKTHTAVVSAGVTIREPIYLAGKIVYKERFETNTSTVADLDKTKTEVKKRNLVTIGLGINGDLNPSFLASSSLIGPLGVAGELTVAGLGIKSVHAWVTLGL